MLTELIDIDLPEYSIDHPLLQDKPDLSGVPLFTLTPRQKEAYLIIVRFTEIHNQMPTSRQLAEIQGVTQTAGHLRIQALWRRGWLSKTPAGGYCLRVGAGPLIEHTQKKDDPQLRGKRHYKTTNSPADKRSAAKQRAKRKALGKMQTDRYQWMEVMPPDIGGREVAGYETRRRKVGGEGKGKK